ncbi:glycine-rich domain-containing protein [Enterobacter roggenkampii]|uniref:glycine-rich domain-containing protein n=1 Tax=Enterobacter roggenkampii TaxID=1812935 RepID=UPI00201A6842|nr:hypothetical protein [Enterobacter roggenkampii]MCL5589082.1 hypothetical protein [Enterobacter roggenkampii]
MALTLLAANNAQTVLAAGISSTATSLTVNAGTGTLFPSPVAGTSFFKLTIIDAATGSLTEIVHVTARAGDVFTIQRGQEGTVPRAWSANDIAANMMTAGTLSYILGNFQPLDPTLTALAALVGVANKLPYFNGDDTAALTDLTQVGRDIIGKSTIADILTYLGLGDGTGRLINVKTFTSSGTYTPTAGMKYCIVEGIGGGGAGGGAPITASGNVGLGAGGHAGAYGKATFTIADIGASKPVTVGAGGVTTTNAGGDGGNSSLGSLVVFTGGKGGPSAGNTAPPLSAGNGNVPSVASSGANIIRGTGALSAIGIVVSAAVGFSGAGANSAYGAGGGAVNNTGNGAAAVGFGSGGSGAMALSSNATARPGGNGAPGFVVIYEYA